MSFLKADPDKATTGDFQPVDKGEYEVFVSEVKLENSKNKGTPGVAITFTIRDDISGQKFGRRKIFDRLWISDAAMWRFNNLAVACGAPKGQEFATVEDFMRFIQSKPLIIGIDHESYTANDGTPKVREAVKYFKQSKVGGTGPAPESNVNPFAGVETPIDISDDDLPF